MTMAKPTGGFSRRAFLLGVGGGAASMSIVWGVSELRLSFLGRGKESQDAASLDVHAEYDGWLVTTEDKARLVLVEFTDGWYARETSDGSSWRWTQPTATLSFLNPRRAAVLHVDYDARADLFKVPPRTLTITVGDHVARSFTLDAAGRQHLCAAVLRPGNQRPAARGDAGWTRPCRRSYRRRPAVRSGEREPRLAGHP